MGGTDKGLVDYKGQPLVVAVIDRLAPQVGHLLISANRNLDTYRTLGHAVVSDHDPASFMGPLAGLRAGLAQCATPWMAVVPCDAPAIPDDLVARFYATAAAEVVPAVYAVTLQRPHPVFMLCRRELFAPLDGYLASGQRKVLGWLQSVGAVALRFDDEAAFTNINAPDDLNRGSP